MVLGEVVMLGLMLIDWFYCLFEIIVCVGGLKFIVVDEICLICSIGEMQIYDMKQIVSGGNLQDLFVNLIDCIFVDKVVEFYVIGVVNGLGVYLLCFNMILCMVIVCVGGVSVNGLMKCVKVFCDGKQILKYGLEQLIQVGDLIEVGEWLF